MKEIKWADTYASGEVAFLKAYMMANNTPPLKYIHKLGRNRIDMVNIDIDLIKKTYPDAKLQYMQMVLEDDTDTNENEPIIEAENGTTEGDRKS